MSLTVIRTLNPQLTATICPYLRNTTLHHGAD
jgi:hypothetical protein